MIAWMGNYSLFAQNHAIFSGGITDGFAMTCFLQPTGNLIFAGGSSDGNSQSNFLQSSNNSLFAGGDADGYGQNIGTIGNPNNDCTEDFINVTNPLLASSLDNVFKAIEFIHSDGVLNTRADFLFRAGNSVTLNPEFTLPAGIIFRIEIGPCSN